MNYDPDDNDDPDFAYDMVFFIVDYFLKKRANFNYSLCATLPSIKSYRRMIKMIEKCEKRHSLLLRLILDDFQMTEKTSFLDFFECVEIWYDHTHISWKKVTLLFTFTVHLALDTVAKGKPEFVRNIIYFLAAFLDERLNSWFRLKNRDLPYKITSFSGFFLPGTVGLPWWGGMVHQDE
jgi:hypothetical protein